MPFTPFSVLVMRSTVSSRVWVWPAAPVVSSPMGEAAAGSPFAAIVVVASDAAGGAALDPAAAVAESGPAAVVEPFVAGLEADGLVLCFEFVLPVLEAGGCGGGAG